MSEPIDHESSDAAERHLASVGLLNGVCSLAMTAAATALLRGAFLAVDPEEAMGRIVGALACLGVALLTAWLAWGLRRHSRVARRIHQGASWLALVVIPVGTAWGAYSLWALGNRADVLFDPKVARRKRLHPAQPYYFAVMPAVAAGIAVTTFGLLKADEFWLDRNIRWAADREAAQRQAVGRSIERLRTFGAGEEADTVGSMHPIDGGGTPSGHP